MIALLSSAEAQYDKSWGAWLWVSDTNPGLHGGWGHTENTTASSGVPPANSVFNPQDFSAELFYNILL